MMMMMMTMMVAVQVGIQREEIGDKIEIWIGGIGWA